ncbi:SDR family NAD(P)-dependent oxidoreductase [Streptomyces xiamenensis]|uniref:SDR family oxidoreductase n=1 Tax=Streptomyces xiamenensis TaxID=408015 RepID=UPI00341FEA71
MSDDSGTSVPVPAGALRAWLAGRVAEMSGVEPEEVDAGTPFDVYGVNSTDAVSLSGELADRFGLRLSPTALYDHPTVDALVAHLVPAGPERAAVPDAATGPAADDDPVCVVGMACRFPGGADSPERFWELLSAGYDAARDVPADRWDAHARYAEDPDAPGTAYTTKGAFVDDLAGFDAAFFGISPREALRMDPQQRMLLEVAWQALQDAGCAPDRLRSTATGVFVGMMPGSQYASLQRERGGPGVLDDPYLGLGTSSSVVAGRLSYLLDLRGPALLLDTACSSSLVALHLAARSLRSGESDLALVGGVSAILHPDTYRQGSKMRMLARDGRCKTFDAAADGFLMGEGCGVVVLERLSEATARGHRVLAVIRGSAVNQDGTSNGLTAPNGTAQRAVIRAALAEARLAPGDVDFVEAHGSGTLLGDSIEMTGLHEVFGADRDPERPLVVGAVKTNVGHLTGAAGMAGLIKTVLALRHGRIPANLHHREPSPAIDWDGCPTLLPDRLTEWPGGSGPRIAGVSSFGWSGTNSHVVLAQAPDDERPAEPVRDRVLPLSARTPEALRATAGELAARLRREPAPRLGDVAHTLTVGRSVLERRAAVSGASHEELAAALERLAAGGAVRAVPPGGPAVPVTLLLPGTGELRVGTGRALYGSSTAFREAFDACAEAAGRELGLDLREVLYPAGVREQAPSGTFGPAAALGGADAGSPLHERLEVGHAAVFAVDYACAALWRERGVVPAALLGYSLGEYVAACLAGVFSLSDALLLVIRRARLVAAAAPGAMTTVALAADRLAPLLTEGVALAATNGPLTCVVSGPVPAVSAFEERLRAERVAFMRIATERAMHHPLLAGQGAELEALVASLPRSAPDVPYLSNVTGDWITDDQARDPGYWARHLCSTVRFAEGVRRLATAGGPRMLLEAGPGQLASFATQIATAEGAAAELTALPTLPGPVDRRGPGALVAASLARLWERGAGVEPVYGSEDDRVVSLDGYPFEHQRFWPEPTGEPAARAAAPAAEVPATGPAPEVWAPVWEPAQSAPGTPAGPFLIHADTLGVGERLARSLRDTGPCVVVTAGTAYARTGPDTYTIRPDAAEDHARLLAELPADRLPRTVAQLWSVTGTETPGPDRVRSLGFTALVRTATALADRVREPVRLLVVTDGAQAVRAEEPVQAAKATVTGAVLTIPQEYPGWSCRLLDLAPVDAGDPAALERAARTVADELARTGGENVVAVRDGVRSVQRHRPAAPPVTAPVVPRADGAVLITGGLGSLGLVIAGHLADRAPGIGLVLTGRTGLPPRPQWDALLTDRPDSPVARRVRGVLDLERRGAQVRVLAADAADAGALRTAVTAARTEFGALRGVVHAAGLTDAEVFAPLASLTDAQVTAHFDAKVRGTVALDEALTGERPDFVLLMSSMSAVLGGLGFAAYAAANAFLDRFAQQQRAAGLTGWQSIAWDTWRSTVDGPGAAGLGDSLSRYSFTPGQGLAVLDRVLGTADRLVVAQGDLAARLAAWTGGAEPAAPATGTAPFARPDAAAGGAGPDAERRLAALWRVALGSAEVGTHDNFFDLGGNSLIGMQLMNSIGKEFGLTLPAVALFEAPTIGAMAAYLRERGAGAPPAAAPVPAATVPEAAPVPEAAQAPPPASAAVSVPGPAPVPVPAAPPPPAPPGAELPGDDAIAVIGMAGRFPGAADLERFWRVLRDGEETISFFTEEELVAAGVPAEQAARPDYVRARPVLEDVAMFDAEFFGYNPREARLLDPQQRLFLECCWEALESAGYGDGDRPRSVAVYGGANISTYIRKLYEDPETAASVNEYQVVISNDKDALTTNVSYRFNLSGPSLGVQTFCSTSLVATHLAARALLAGECDMALAGGVSVRVPDRVGHVYQEGGMESPDGHVRTFDAAARGSIFGDGSAVVLLKRLSRALEDGDPVAAVIRGSAVNNDGSLKVGFTAPSVRGQAEVISRALTDAGVRPAEVSYVEAHGTATELGDPIEMSALGRAFAGAPVGSCRVGSVKTNLGHLDRAAGATGLIKTVLSLQHRQLPPSLHFTTPNPEIDFENGPFRVNTALTPWESPAGRPRIAGINSLGMGGTNVHVVLQEAPPARESSPGRETQILTLSGRGREALEQAGRDLARHLRRNPELPLADVAFTLQVGRQRFDERRALVVRGTEDALRLLESGGSGGYERRERLRERPVGYAFPGGEAWYPGAAAGLYRTEEAFRAAVDHCRTVLRPLLGTDVLEVIAGAADEDLSPGVTACAAFTAEYALAALFAGWGLRPDTAHGRGTGALTAAVVAGVLSLEDALGVLAEYARTRAGDAGTGDAAGALTSWIRAKVTLAAPALPGAAPDAARATDPAYWAGLLLGTGPDAGTGDAPLGAGTEPPADPDLMVLLLGPADGSGEPDAETILPVLPDHTRRHEAVTAAHSALARAWVLGAVVDWSAYHDGETRNRVPLPTYPFQRSRYWIDTPERAPRGGRPLPASGGTPGSRLAALPKLPTDQWLSVPGWRQLPPRAAGTDTGRWLLLTDARGLTPALAARITAAGGSAVIAAPGDGFARTAADAFTLDPADAGQWSELFAALRAEDDAPLRVAHLWGVDPIPDTLRGTERATTAFHSLLALLQAAGGAGAAAPAAVTVITTGAFDVTGGEPVDPAKATVTGPCKVAPLEYPGLDVRHIDVTAPRGKKAAATLAQRLLPELTSPPAGPGERQLALRGRRRWAATHTPLPPRAVPAPQEVLRQEGVYLITGGLGGIGGAMAHRLATSVRANLVLAGRSGLPERDRWERLVADPDTPGEVVRRIEQVRALEAAGAQVLVVAMDAADPDQVDRAVDAALERFGRLDGVLHAAGVPGLGVMQFKTAEDATAVLRPKLAGAQALRERLARERVDFLALFSSTAAVTGGGPGQADYCAANAALGAHASDAANSPGGTRVVTIDWGEWRWNAWDMALAGFDESTTAFLRANRERIGITFDEGWQALLKVLAGEDQQVVVCSQDIGELASITAGLDLAQLAGRAGNASGARHPRPELAVPYAEPAGDEESAVAELWGQVLGVAGVGADDDFFELGGNSLLGVDLVHRMRSALECPWLPPHVLYEAPTVREVVRLARSADGASGVPAATKPATLRGASV